MKTLFQSKTFWIAVLQALAGVLVIFSSSYPEVGGLLVVKSIVDVFIRTLTNTSITT